MNMFVFIWAVIKDSFLGEENEVRVNMDGRQGETIDGKRLIQQHGHGSRPPKDSGAIVMRAGEFWAVLGSDSGKGPKLAEGEASLYFDDSNYILCKKDGSILIKSSKVQMDVQDLNVSGKITADGSIESKQEIKDPMGNMAEIRTTFNTHTHPVLGAVPVAPPTPPTTTPPTSPMT